MKHRLWITIISTALALAGMSGPASARPARQYRRHPYTYAGHTRRQRSRIVGNRRTRVYRVLAYRSPWSPSQDQIYFKSAAQARAAGYRPAGQGAIPVAPPLTWRGARRQLPSLGKHRVTPQLPHDMQKPVAPPTADQPPVTPTQPMPN